VSHVDNGVHSYKHTLFLTKTEKIFLKGDKPVHAHLIENKLAFPNLSPVWDFRFCPLVGGAPIA